jgi:Tc toxin complex TcA C-terminal TcB-binding domain
VSMLASALYTFRYTDTVFGSVFQEDGPVSAALSAIDAKLTQGHAAFLSRSYQDAVNAYNDAGTLVYGQLHPAASGGATAPSLDSSLFEPLLSLGLEWMNVLAPTVPVAAGRPRTPLPGAGKWDLAGLGSAVLNTDGNADAVADWHYAQTLTAAANPEAAQFFHDRAVSAAPDLIGQLDAAADRIGHFDATADQLPADDHTVPRVPLPPAITVKRTYGAPYDDGVALMSWAVGDGPSPDDAINTLYQARVDSDYLVDLRNRPNSPADLAAWLPHIYFYVIPLGRAEALHALGNYQDALTDYDTAAAYPFLNPNIEAPYIWGLLATLYLDWGDQLFRQGDVQGALGYYAMIVSPDDQEPTTSGLYTTAALKPGADIGRQVLADLANIAALQLDPAIVSVIAAARGQLAKISAGLDFFGFWAPTVPIWTFDYLQGVAANFAQLTVSVERDVIDFRSRADQANVTRQQLATSISVSDSESSATGLQADAAQAQVAVYRAGQALAAKRAADARANAQDYTNQSNFTIIAQAVSSQTSGGDNGNWQQLNQLADEWMNGSSINGSRATQAAAEQLAASKANRQYEIDNLNRQATEMGLAQSQANAEYNAAVAQGAAAQAAADVASIKAQAASDLLSAFDSQTFSPDVWSRMGDAVYRLYQRYLTMALYAAKLMQRAYNFETDQSLAIIKPDYSSDEVNGLLAGDALLADIQSFTFDLISVTRSKRQPVKQTISLAERYPYQFEKQLRATGAMNFQTTLDDFDSRYPGTYAGRITAVEVEIDGLVPPTGVSGSLTNTGISTYRLPIDAWSNPSTPAVKYRVQSSETLVLSDYSARADSLLDRQDSKQLRIFEGAGLASSWRLELPKAINDIDYGALLDVRLVFSYEARYDPAIATVVNAGLAARPGFTHRQRAVPLRWIYPDAFFAFQRTGTLSITLSQADFRNNETQPKLTAAGILVTTDTTVPAHGLKVGLATPAATAPVTATLGATGAADSTTGGSPWGPLATGSALGGYTVSLTAADNPSLVKNGQLDLSPLVNIVLLVDYAFTPRS